MLKRLKRERFSEENIFNWDDDREENKEKLYFEEKQNHQFERDYQNSNRFFKIPYIPSLCK